MSYDTVIVGGGHNGLTCAWYLARAGYKVRVLERREMVGGAAITEEFHPGFRNSVASYSVGLLSPEVIADMELARHGLKIVLRPLSYFSPSEDGRYLIMDRDAQRNHDELSQWSKRDAERLPAWHAKMDRLVDFIRTTLLETPPNMGGGFSDILAAAKVGNRARKLGLSSQNDLIDLFGKSAGDMLDQWFETDVLKGLLGWDAVVGNYASPYTPGSAYVLLHHVFGITNGIKGAWGHAIGGMGSITQAMARACTEKGVEISVDAPVREIIVEHGAVHGVVLETGERVMGKSVASNIHPKLLYGKLIDERYLGEEFNTRIKGWKSGSGTFRMNVALSELPNFTCKPGTTAAEHHSAAIIIAPSLSYLDQGYLDAKIHGWSRTPGIEMHIPSTIDDSLAPKGQHVASLFCHHFAPVLPNGASWDDNREAAADTVIDTMTRHAPNFKASIIARSILSPFDLERKLALVGGDIFHGALSLDQLFSARPVPGYGAYRGPLKWLYMCGSGTHPGGGVTGAPGHNAAREIMRDLKANTARRFRAA